MVFEALLITHLIQEPKIELKDTFKKVNYYSYYEVDTITTAYTLGDNYTPNQVMASGEKPYYGACAYNKVKLGTKIVIGDKMFVVKDRAVDDDIVDIYLNSYAECIKYGKQKKRIKILEE